MAKDLEQQVVDIDPCAVSLISVLLDSLSLPEGRDEKLEDEDTECDEARTTNNSMLASLQAINEELEREDLTDDLTCDNDDNYPFADEKERAI